MSIASALASDARLHAIPIHVVSTAIQLLRTLQADIILVQPSAIPVNVAPPILPPSIILFLQDAFGIASDAVEALWDVIRDEVWVSPMPKLSEEERELFRKHGWDRGLTAVKIFPLSHTCITAGCEYNGRILKKDEKSQAVLYTLGDGVQPVFNIHLTCTDCKTTFHNNFAVNGGTRTYYPGIVPDYIQVGEHQFVERKLAAHWISLMFRGWSKRPAHEGLWLAVWNAAYYRARMGCVCSLDPSTTGRREKTILEVPHGGNSENRFTEAMSRRNTEVVNFGNNTVNHCCDRCFRENVVKRDGSTGAYLLYRVSSVFLLSSGNVQVVVGDGLSIGRPICGVTHCPKPLSNNRNRFCNDHQDEENFCSVTGCHRDIIPGTKSCDNQEHQDMEKLHYTHVSASTTLGERYQRHRQRHHANDARRGTLKSSTR
ncbi:hypothetical protein MKEN_00935500 [Mycena kentingensis (nom. inval.)]|nr:hypothetical protein MKEN_00935500 [Mycena kentingensis (nom. inval.)]